MSLVAESIYKSYQGRRVVDGVSLSVNKGEIVGLLGPNGAGKTTCFYMAVGLVKPDAGKITVGDANVTRLPVYARARMGIGYLPQENSVFRNLTVRENIELVIQESNLEYESGVSESLMRDFGLTELQDSPAYALSGGERRRVEIARCIAMQPSFILLDEPFSGIDPIAVADIQTMIKKLRDSGYGILITDHNVRETLSITDRAYLIYEGKIVVEGTPGEMMESKLARKFYLGEDFSWGMPMEPQTETVEHIEDKVEAEVKDEPHDKPVNPYATTDEEWARVAMYFESKQKGRARTKNPRELVDAMRWVIKTGSLWKDLPPEYGAWRSVYNKYASLRKTDAWGKILQELNMTSKLTLKIKFDFGFGGDDED